MNKAKKKYILCRAETSFWLSSWRARLVWTYCWSQPAVVVGQTPQLSKERPQGVQSPSVETRRSLHLSLGTARDWGWSCWSCKRWGNVSVNFRWGSAILRFYQKNVRQLYPGYKIIHNFCPLIQTLVLNLLSSWILQWYQPSQMEKNPNFRNFYWML